MEKPVLKKENTHLLYDNRFVKLFDMQYKEDRHYMNASRRAIDDIVALKTDALIAQGYCLHHQAYENRFLK